MDKALCVFGRRHPVPAHLLDGGAEQFVESIVEGKDIVEEIVFPGGQLGEVDGVLQRGLELFALGDVFAGAKCADHQAVCIIYRCVVPGDMPQLPAAGKNGVLEILRAFHFAGENPSERPVRLPRRISLGEKSCKPILPDQLAFIIAKHLAALGIDELYAAFAIEHDDDRRHGVEEVLRIIPFLTESLLGILLLRYIAQETDVLAILAASALRAHLDVEDGSILAAVPGEKTVGAARDQPAHVRGDHLRGLFSLDIGDVHGEKLFLAVAAHAAVGIIDFEYSAIDIGQPITVQCSLDNRSVVLFAFLDCFSVFNLLQLCQAAFRNYRYQFLYEEQIAVELLLCPDGHLPDCFEILRFVEPKFSRSLAIEFEIRFFQKKLAGEKIAIMHTIDDNGRGVIDKAVRAPVGNGWIRFMKVVFYVLVAFDADAFRFAIASVESRADFLPCRSCQDVAIIVDDCRGEGIDFIQSVLEFLEVPDINEILQSVFHGMAPESLRMGLVNRHPRTLAAGRQPLSSHVESCHLTL